MNKELIVFGRTYSCPDLARTQRFLKANNVNYRQINIDEDEGAMEIVEPAPVPSGRSARSFDRGSMITEPSDEALHGFLRRHGFQS